MPDVRVVLSRVREGLVAVSRRREELQRELGDLDREYARLAAAAEVMERHVGDDAGSSSSDDSAHPLPLTERILDALVAGSAKRRSDLLPLFEPSGVNANTLDSAVRRLIDKGLVRRQGRRLVVVSASASDPGTSDGDRRQADPATVVAEPASVGNGGSSAVSGQEDGPGGTALAPLPIPVDDVPLTVKVHEAVATSVATTRRALIRHFAVQGVKGSAVDNALANLRKRGRLGRTANREWAVVGSNVPSAEAEAASRGS